MNRTLLFLFAATLGATIGALTALELAPALGIVSGLAATLGVIVGGITGYITVDFRQFMAGVKYAGLVAYQAPISACSAYWESSREKKMSAIFSSMAVFLIFIYLAILLSTLDGDMWVLGTALSFVAAFSTYMGHSMVYDSSHPVDGKKMLYWLSPIGLAHTIFFIALPWLVVGLFKIGRWLVRQTGVFGKTLFVAVHSERRLLCCFDAMFGTLVGYYAGSWPVGTVAGIAFAFISYELISKRLLKLQTT